MTREDEKVLRTPLNAGSVSYHGKIQMFST